MYTKTNLLFTLFLLSHNLLCNISHDSFSYDTHVINIPFHDTNNITIETLDEENNQITFYSPDTMQLYVFKTGNGIINSFSLQNVARYITNPNGKCAAIHYNNDNIEIIHNFDEQTFCSTYPKELGMVSELNAENTDIIIGYSDSKKYFLDFLDVKTKEIFNCNAHRIEFDITGKICMVVQKDTTTIFKKDDNNTRTIIKTFDTIAYARLNPNGQQLAARQKDNSYKLITIDNAQEFSLKPFNRNPMFSKDGKYVATSFYDNNSGIHTITNTSTGKKCLTFCSPANLLFFEKNYLAICPSSFSVLDASVFKNAYLIDINVLDSITTPDVVYTLEELVQQNIATHFENACFSMLPYSWFAVRYILHPSQKHIVTLDKHNTLRFIDIQSKKTCFSLENVKSYKFSPTGKMLFISYHNKPCELLVTK